MKRKVEEDYKRSINMRITEDENEESNIMNIKFEFCFDI